MTQGHYRVTMEGVTPGLLQDSLEKFDPSIAAHLDALRKKAQTSNAEEDREVWRRETIRHSAYVDEQGHLCIMQATLQKLVPSGCMGSETKRGQGKRTAAGIMVMTDAKLLLPEFGLKPATLQKLLATPKLHDSRWGRNPNTGDPILIHRPRYRSWKASFEVEVDPDVASAAVVQKAFEFCGRFIGIGPWRPERKGIFGRFVVKGVEPADRPSRRQGRTRGR